MMNTIESLQNQLTVANERITKLENDLTNPQVLKERIIKHCTAIERAHLLGDAYVQEYRDLQDRINFLERGYMSKV